jgi:hypothetical protein
MRAACFAIVACGYVPRCALNISDSGAVRLDVIVDLIASCDFSIHDISRVELDKDSKLPRFNMPLELGIDLGLRMRGPKPQRRRKTLILDGVAHRYDKTLSDLSGMDVEIHDGSPGEIIRRIREWLNTNRRPGSVVLPGGSAICDDFKVFQQIAPSIAAGFRLDAFDAVGHVDFLHLVDEALPEIDRMRKSGSLPPTST